jgi:integrase
LVTEKYEYTPWRGGYKTKAEARDGLRELRRELESGLRVDADDMTFGQFADLWHSERVTCGIIAESSAEKDSYLVRRLNRHIGDMKLRDITTNDVSTLLVVLAKNGTSANSIHALFAIMKSILKAAVNRDLLMRNPCDRVSAPRIPESTRRALSESELARFTRRLADYYIPSTEHSAQRNTQMITRPMDGYGMTVWIALATGMRKSEILGLQWACIDLSNGFIDVKQTLKHKQKLGQNPVQPRAKSRAGRRRIPIDTETVTRLRDWRAQQAEYFLATIGSMPTSESPVISNERCGFLNQHNFDRWWRDFCVRIGFARWIDDDENEIPPQLLNDKGHPVDDSGRPYSRNNQKPRITRHYDGLHLHELRHTYGTLMVANGVDLKTVQYLMGHSSASVTLNLYAHAQEAQKRAASDLIGNLLNAEEPSNIIAL